MKIADLEMDVESKKLLSLCAVKKDIYYLCGVLNKSYPTILQRVNILTSMGFLEKTKIPQDHKFYYVLSKEYEI